MAPDKEMIKQRLTLPITGMSCANCAGSVERTLAAVEGVSEVSVNLALEQASVVFVAGTADEANFAKAIRAAGYDVKHSIDEANAEGEQETRASFWPFIEFGLAVILTLPLLAQMIVVALGGAPFLLPLLELALAAPVQFWIGRRFYLGAWRAARGGTGSMDTLVVLGTSAAFFYSLWRVLNAAPGEVLHLHFGASAVIITLVLAGKVLEGRAKRSASAALRALLALRPEKARIRHGKSEVEVAIEEVKLGDCLIVRPGERIAVDGRIIEGESELDESLISGESVPVMRKVGDFVMAGALNGPGLLSVSAERVGADTTLHKIANMVAEAQEGKAPIQRLVDRISAIFVPLILVIALVTLACWMLSGAPFETAITTAISVLVIACPCALGLATPTALVAGTGAAAAWGILIKHIEALERAGGISVVVFDKTGTLTEGKPVVTEIKAFSGTEPSLLRLAASVQIGSEHPLGKAAVREAEGRGLELFDFTDFTAKIGAGVLANVAGETVRIGTQSFAAPRASEAEVQAAEALAAEGQTVAWVTSGTKILGLIAMRDEVREDAAKAVEALQSRGIHTVLLTGDNPAAAARIADLLGIDEVKAGVKPDQKAQEITAMQARGLRVAMVGDGINDAPALAAADLGIAMGSGTDIALESADYALLRPRPSLVGASLEIAEATAAKIKQNLFWAFAYNAVLIPVAAFGWLSPVFAGAAMALSSISVVSNSLLLRKWRPQSERQS